MKLSQAENGRDYIIRDILTDDEELKSFLFSLGCYSGEVVSVVTKKRHSLTVSIKDARYNVDMDFADAVEVEDN